MIRTADMIMVDEFSLLSNKLLHTLQDVLHKVRRNKPNPFAGITVLLVGDPLQLPAVDLDIFDSALFRNHFVPFVLTDVMRQDGAHLINLLNRVRIGEESDEDHLILQQHIAPNSDVSLQDLEDAPLLVGRKNAMNRCNEHFMAQLGSSIVTFDTSYVDMGGAPTNQAMCDYINSRIRRVLPQLVCVASGMRARLIRNVSIEIRLVNSTLVVIKRWSKDVILVSPVGQATEYPICRFQQITPVHAPSMQVKIIQFSLLPGYSCTVHSTQGCCYDCFWVDMAAFFAAAHAYIALSRAPSLQGLFVPNYRRDAFLVDPYYVQLRNWFVATNVLSPKPPRQVAPYLRGTFTTSLIIRIMCVHRAWSVVSQLPQRLDAGILKVNMLHISQYVSFPYWSYMERQLRGDKKSLDIDDLNEDTTEQICKQGRPVGTTRQPTQGFELLDACNNPRVFAAKDLAPMSVVQLRTMCAAHYLSTSGTKAQFQECILQKQNHIQPPSSTPSPRHSQARVQLVPSSINGFSHLEPRVNYFGEDFWPQERSDSMEDNLHLSESAWLSCAAVQCLLEVLLPQGNFYVKPVIQDVTLAVIMQHARTSRVVYTLGDALPVLLTSQHSTVGVHYVLVTDISDVNKTLVVHDPKNHASTCGSWFRAIVSKMGCSFTWHHYGTHPDSDTCGFRVVMLAMQWCQTNRLTGQLPRWLLTYCAGILQLLADDTSSLRSSIYTFPESTYEDALREYDAPVDWAMTEGGPLPTVNNSDMEAAIRSPQSNSASGPSSR